MEAVDNRETFATVWNIFLFRSFLSLKSCTSLLENVSRRVPTRSVWDLSKFGVSPSNKYCLSPLWACAANAVGFSYLKLLIIFVHNPDIMCYEVLNYYILCAILFVFVSVNFFSIDVPSFSVLACNLSLVFMLCLSLT
jgi:hypothetical protein